MEPIPKWIADRFGAGWGPIDFKGPTSVSPTTAAAKRKKTPRKKIADVHEVDSDNDFDVGMDYENMFDPTPTKWVPPPGHPARKIQHERKMRLTRKAKFPPRNLFKEGILINL